MPNRYLRDWTDSFNMAALSDFEERVFIRLIMKADDHGRFFSDPIVVRNLLFPTFDNISLTNVRNALTNVSKQGLVVLYVDDSGRKLLEIKNFGQRARTESKFPPPNDRNLRTNDRDLRPYIEDEDEDESEDEDDKEVRLSSNLSKDESFDLQNDESEKVKAKRVAVPYKEIVSLYHEKCKTMPRIQMMDDSRKRHIAAFYKQLKMDIEIVEEYFEQANKSDFLSGRMANKKSNWKCTLDFLLKQTTITKLVEGVYDNEGRD